jgi:Cytochrome c oxidase subunit IV
MSDLRVQILVFAGIGGFLLLITGVYWFTSDEEAGAVMLLLTAGLAAVAAAYLRVQEYKLARSEPAPGAAAEAAGHEHYLPHASVWPLGVGVAAFLLANGLVLGVLFLVPGLLVLALSLAGFCAQTRRRD